MKPVNYELVNFTPSKLFDDRWFDIRSWSFDSSLTDEQLISNLVTGQWYGDAYWSPWDMKPDSGSPRHGPYLRDSISRESFQEISAEDALVRLNRWIFELGDIEKELIRKIENRVLFRFSEKSKFYYLNVSNLALEEPPLVFRQGGFHEFLIINREKSELTLLVATDD